MTRGAGAGFVTGLVSSTFSTLVVSLAARRIGRDVKLDWMEVGSILLRRRALQERPPRAAVAAGIVVHQSADVLWATVFGWGYERLGLRGPRPLLAAALPWAFATAAVEYYAILKWLQPVVPMQQPYWVGASVHVASSSAYPLMLRETRARTAAGLAGGLALAAAGAGYARLRGEPPWPFRNEAGRRADRHFLRAMTHHHEAGVWLSRLCADKAAHPGLRALGRLMLAHHMSEIDVMRDWWRDWEGGELPPPTDAERREMPGMPPEGAKEELEALDAEAFERRFLELMVAHHLGGIAMAERVRARGGDPRIRIFADELRHMQVGQTAEMQAHQRRLGAAEMR